MIVVTLPNYLKNELGISATLAGFIGSLYGFVQFFSCPIAGGWSDALGFRKVILLCLVFCTPAYAFLSFEYWPLVIMSRLWAGSFKHTQNLCRSYLAAFADQNQQLKAYGRLNAMGNVGYILGPAVSGLVLQMYGYWAVFMMTSLCFGLVTFIAFLYFPGQNSVSETSSNGETLIKRDKNHNAIKEPTSGFCTIIQEIRCVAWSNQWDLFATKFLLTFAILLYRSSYNWLLTDRYQMSATNQNYLTSFQGVISFITAFNVKEICSIWNYLRRRRDVSRTDANLHIYNDTTIFLAMAVLGLMLGPNIQSYISFLALFCICTSIIRVVSINLTTERCYFDEQGLIFGLNASFASVSRCLAPFFGGLSHDFHPNACAFSAFLLIFVSYVINYSVTSRVQHKLVVHR